MLTTELPSLLAAAVLLAAERIAYALVWRRPAAFCALCAQLGWEDPVAALQRAFTFFKVLQAAVFAGWCWRFGVETGWPQNFATPLGALAVAAIAVGQALNFGVFWRLGRVGVFYGNRLGHPVPWREGFPFSVCAHPQYVGAALTVWGVFLLARYPHGDWIALPLLETLYYVLGAHVESLPAADAVAEEG